MKNLLLIVLLFMTIGFGWHFYGEIIKERVDIEGFIAEPPFIGINALRVDNQNVEDIVRIRLVNLSQKGFVVLQNDEDGPGKVIGVSTLLEDGRKNNFDIALSENVEDGFVYVSLYRDDGNGSFDIENDIPVRGPSLSPIQVKFLLAHIPGSEEKQLKAVHVQKVAEEEISEDTFRENIK